MRVLSLFAGIGGFDLGLERAGMKTSAFVEIDPFCQAVLSKHWPGVPIHADVRNVTAETIGTDIDLICGGFPCQPHSVAGLRLGKDDERDLWPEFFRVIREIRPRWVLAENVPGLLSIDSGRFFGSILRDMASIGYDVQWDCVSAGALGAPHRRERVWIVAYPAGIRCGGGRTRRPFDAFARVRIQAQAQIANSNRERLEIYAGDRSDARGRFPDAIGCPRQTVWEGGWPDRPPISRVAPRLPHWMDRVRAIGNSLVPLIPELIGLAIMDHEHDSAA